jgi:hypothetical protein
MVKPHEDRDHARPKRRVLFAIQILLTLVTGLLAIPAWSRGDLQTGKLLTGLCACSAVSVLLRMGWLVPCTIGGILAGAFLDAGIKGGPIDAQASIQNICLGAFAGLAVGIVLDIAARVSGNRKRQ